MRIVDTQLEVPFGQGNAEYNRNEPRVSDEVYDLYCFLHAHPTMAPNRKKDVLRASVNYTPFGYIFAGLVSAQSAELIDARLRDGGDPCAGMQRDHYYTWKETSEYFFSRPLMPLTEFWDELKRRNEIVLLLKEEHSRVGAFQRAGHGREAYALAGIRLLRVEPKALRLTGNKAGLFAKHWPEPSGRMPFVFEKESAV